MIVLAIVVGVATGTGASILDIALVCIEAVLFVVMVIFVGSILLPNARKRLAKGKEPRENCDSEPRHHGLTPLVIAIMLCFGLSFLASYVGLAAIIGAFLAGMAFAEFKDKWPCEQDFHPINQLLVPFFFIFVGLSVDLSSLADVLGLAVLVTLVALATKFVGCGLGAMKLGARSATIIGVGMTPRGEVGIIVASIGLGMAVISDSIFSVVVFMSMATTIIAPFLLAWAFRRKGNGGDEGVTNGEGM
jgi:Kef-type K+ transport system membrane component KefB